MRGLLKMWETVNKGKQGCGKQRNVVKRGSLNHRSQIAINSSIAYAFSAGCSKQCIGVSFEHEE